MTRALWVQSTVHSPNSFSCFSKDACSSVFQRVAGSERLCRFGKGADQALPSGPKQQLARGMRLACADPNVVRPVQQRGPFAGASRDDVVVGRQELRW